LWPSSDGPQPNIKILFLRGTLKSSWQELLQTCSAWDLSFE
jgi:hypothetical protein